jgi:hypothetical protein
MHASAANCWQVLLCLAPGLPGCRGACRGRGVCMWQGSTGEAGAVRVELTITSQPVVHA